MLVARVTARFFVFVIMYAVRATIAARNAHMIQKSVDMIEVNRVYKDHVEARKYIVCDDNKNEHSSYCTGNDNNGVGVAAFNKSRSATFCFATMWAWRTFAYSSKVEVDGFNPLAAHDHIAGPNGESLVRTI